MVLAKADGGTQEARVMVPVALGWKSLATFIGDASLLAEACVVPTTLGAALGEAGINVTR